MVPWGRRVSPPKPNNNLGHGPETDGSGTWGLAHHSQVELVHTIALTESPAGVGPCPEDNRHRRG
jgi:hypothetical protein